jgi:CRP-like cAMP-binding protein
MSRPLSRRRGSLFDRIKRAEALGDAADVGPVVRRVLGRSAQMTDSATNDVIASIVSAAAAAASSPSPSPASPAPSHEPRPKVHRSVMSVFSRLLKSKSEMSARDLLAEAEAGDGDSVVPPSINIEPLSLRDWKVICTGAYTEKFHRGELIVCEDAPNSALFRIQSGNAVVLKNLRHAARLASGEHETIEISQLQPGDWLGEMSFIAHGTENAYATSSVRVTSASATVYVVPHDYVLRLFACDTAIFARFFYTLALVLAQRARFAQLSARRRTAARRAEAAERRSAGDAASAAAHFDAERRRAAQSAQSAQSARARRQRARHRRHDECVVAAAAAPIDAREPDDVAALAAHARWRLVAAPHEARGDATSRLVADEDGATRDDARRRQFGCDAGGDARGRRQVCAPLQSARGAR